MIKFIKTIGNMNKESNKSNLAKKLLKGGGRIQKLRAEEASSPIPDIEECSGVTKSQYFFSPIQTRRQRVTNMNPIHELKQAEKKPRKQSMPIKKQEKTLNKNEKMNIEEKLVKNNDDDIKITTSNVLDKTQWEPKNWRIVLENIRQMRANSSAPVDTMGCHKCADITVDEKTQRYQKLIALMLSSQTKDETTYDAMQRLRANSLTPASIAAMETTALQNLLCPVSFYKNKAKYIKQTTRLLIDKYDSDIPQSIKELVALPGVGPKMAHICMATAWQQITGIGVDVHVHRITNRLRWLPKETKEPEHTRLALEKWLPHELWAEVNHLLVGFGQTICTPLRPNCGDCLNREICPSADKTAKGKQTKKKTIIKRDDNDDGGDDDTRAKDCSTGSIDSNISGLAPMKKAKMQKKKLLL